MINLKHELNIPAQGYHLRKVIFAHYNIFCLVNGLFNVKGLRMRGSLVKLLGLVKAVTKLVTGPGVQVLQKLSYL